MEWGARAMRHVEGMTRDEFLRSELVRDAVRKRIEAIGEAAIHLMRLEPGIELHHPGLHLNLAYATRNQLSHGYFSIDAETLWITVIESIPATVAEARRVIANRGVGET